MSDQAENLRQLAITAPPTVREALSTPPMIVVTGAKIGVGATTAAVNLGAVLADAGLRTMLVDASTAQANMAQVAGIHVVPSETPTLQPGPGGALLLAGGNSPPHEGPESRRAQRRWLAEIQARHDDTDVVVVDTGSGLSPSIRRFWRQARLVFVVTTPDNPAIMDCYAAIKFAAADDLESDIRELVNRCDQTAAAEKVIARISTACQRFLGRPVTAAPSLPSYTPKFEGLPKAPRVWETPDSTFGHAALWLGRAAIDALAAQSVVNKHAQTAA
jgi:flagellar biosynthesis protein FlhG